MKQTQNQKTLRTKGILREALRGLLRHKPLAEITVTELCAAAEVTRSTFYRHYNIPRDIIEEIWQQIDSNTALEVSKITTATPLPDQVLSWVRPIYADRDKWQLVLLSGFQPTISISDPAPTMYPRFARHGLDRDNSDLLYRFMVNGIISLVAEWICSPQPTEPERFAEQVTKIVGLIIRD